MAQPTSLASLEAGFEQEARLDEPFVVLTVAASLIATLGLLADSAAVVIGAMLIAPWILPLRSASFAIIDGRLNMAVKALLTLAVGVAITIALSASLGWLARLPVLGDEVLRRTTPNLLDLGIALVAGSIATYGRLRQEAVSSIAGTAIAVALVPPVCVLGLLLSIQQWEPARGAALLFAANLLGILSGGLLTLVVSQASLRQKLWRSRVGLVSLLLTGLLLIPLTGSFLTLVGQAQRRLALQEVERAITESLRQRTITLGKDSELTGVSIDWTQNPPLIKAAVSVSKPNLPTPKQVAAVQDFINKQMNFNYRLVVKRVSIDVIGPEAAPNLEPTTTTEEGSPKPLTPPLPPPPPPVPATEESSAAVSKPSLNDN